MTIGKEKVFDLSGGELCLDFANTVGGARPASPKEYLHGYGDLLSFSRQAGAVSAVEARALAREAERRPQEAERALRRAIELRESIYRIFTAIAAGAAPSAQDLHGLNRALGDALRHLGVARAGAAFGWIWEEDSLAFDRMLWPILRSAAELLVRGDPIVRQCASETCTWLFLDRSRNRSRRWCDMKSCGNREKVRRHYHRTHTGG